MEELKRLLEEQAKAFEEFKKANDSGNKETAEKANAAITAIRAEIAELRTQMDDAQKKANRPKSGAAADAEDSEYAKAFDRFLRKNDVSNLRAAVSIGDDGAGGYLVPDTLDTEIERYETDNTPMRSLCRVISVSNEHYEKLVNQGGVDSGWVDETEDRTETKTPEWSSLTPYFGEVYAMPGYTQRALDDVGLDLQAELAQDVGVEFAERENESFTVGNGVKKPRGILGYAATATADGTRAFNTLEYIASGASGSFDGDDLIDLIHKLKRGYRTGASWMISNLGLASVRKLKDTTTGQYLWQPGLKDGQPDMLLGYPVNENDNWPDPAADAYAVGFGNWRRAYYIVDIRGTRVLRDEVTKKGKVLFYSWKRVGGFLVNDRAVKLLKLGTS